MANRGERPCPQCGAVVPDIAGPVHAYVPGSPGCWMTFGRVQAETARRFGHPPAQGILVDSYMAQHPGDGSDRRDRQSVFVHLAGLCAVLEAGVPTRRSADILRRLVSDSDEFPILRRGSGAGDLTLLHVLGARDPSDHERRAREWANAVWWSWSEHHGVIRDAVAPYAR